MPKHPLTKILIIIVFSFAQIARADECCIRGLQPANSGVADAIGVAISAPHTVPSIVGMATLGWRPPEVTRFDLPLPPEFSIEPLKDL